MMNKKAFEITSTELVVIAITLIIIVLGAILFIRHIPKEVKEGADWIGQKAGLMTPAGKTIENIQGYIGVLLSDDVINAINNSKLFVDTYTSDYEAKVRPVPYDKLSEKEKLEQYYVWAKSRVEADKITFELSDEDEIYLNTMNMKLDLAYDYSYNHYIFYTKLSQPKNEIEAGKNCDLLKTLKSKMESLSIRVPADFTDITGKVNALKTELGDIDKDCCSVGSTICEDKLKYLCRWGKEVDRLNIISDTKCVRDLCDTEPDADSCNRNPKCYVNWYTANWKDSVGGSFDGCRDCKDVSCPDNNHKTCLDIIKKCGKCKATYDSAGIFKACAAEP